MSAPERAKGQPVYAQDWIDGVRSKGRISLSPDEKAIAKEMLASAAIIHPEEKFIYALKDDLAAKAGKLKEQETLPARLRAGMRGAWQWLPGLAGAALLVLALAITLRLIPHNNGLFVLGGSGHKTVNPAPTSTFATAQLPVKPSRDEGMLAMMADVGGISQVFVLPADCSDWRMVSDGQHSSNWPSLSPDGSRVAFAVNYDGNNYNFDIVIADIASGQIHRLTTSAAVEEHPIWSPDGGKIAFESERFAGKADIYLIDADGSNLRQLAGISGPITLSGWSSDGKETYFTDDQSIPGQPSRLPVQLSAYDLATGQVRPIARLPQRLKGGEQPAVSPDGNQIAYVKDTGSSSVIVIKEGEQEKQVSEGQGDAFLPIWSPDGKWLVYAQQIQDSLVPVFVQMKDGSAVYRFEGLSGQVSSWVAAHYFSLDGSRIAKQTAERLSAEQ